MVRAFCKPTSSALIDLCPRAMKHFPNLKDSFCGLYGAERRVRPPAVLALKAGLGGGGAIGPALIAGNGFGDGGASGGGCAAGGGSGGGS